MNIARLAALMRRRLAALGAPSPSPRHAFRQATIISVNVMPISEGEIDALIPKAKKPVVNQAAAGYAFCANGVKAT